MINITSKANAERYNNVHQFIEPDLKPGDFIHPNWTVVKVPEAKEGAETFYAQGSPVGVCVLPGTVMAQFAKRDEEFIFEDSGQGVANSRRLGENPNDELLDVPEFVEGVNTKYNVPPEQPPANLEE